MSGIVQTSLSPVLRESKTTPNKQQQHHKKSFNFHQKNYNNNFKSKNDTSLAIENDKANFKKRQKIQLPNRFLLGKCFILLQIKMFKVLHTVSKTYYN